MLPASPLPLSDEEIRRAATDMIRIYGSGATAKAEEFVDGLWSSGPLFLAMTWEIIRDRIRELEEADPRS